MVGEAANGQEALQLAEKLHPDVVVMELAMPVLNGIDAAREIHRVSPKCKTILLTMHADRQYILEGLRSGAKGYVMKTHAGQRFGARHSGGGARRNLLKSGDFGSGDSGLPK